MIDPGEKWFPIRELPKRYGKRTGMSSVYRWISKGIAGVRLETVMRGGRRFTSEEAVQRFFTEVTRQRLSVPPYQTTESVSPPVEDFEVAALEARGW